MKLHDVIDRVDEIKPNSVSMELKIAWLNEIEGLLYTEILLKHEGEEREMPEYDMDTDPDTELLVPTIYADLYLFWIMSKIDLQNMELDKYNNDRTLFNNAYDTFSDYWTRTHMPKTTVRELRI